MECSADRPGAKKRYYNDHKSLLLPLIRTNTHTHEPHFWYIIILIRCVFLFSSSIHFSFFSYIFRILFRTFHEPELSSQGLLFATITHTLLIWPRDVYICEVIFYSLNNHDMVDIIIFSVQKFSSRNRRVLGREKKFKSLK